MSKFFFKKSAAHRGRGQNSFEITLISQHEEHRDISLLSHFRPLGCCNSKGFFDSDILDKDHSATQAGSTVKTPAGNDLLGSAPAQPGHAPGAAQLEAEPTAQNAGS